MPDAEKPSPTRPKSNGEVGNKREEDINENRHSLHSQSCCEPQTVTTYVTVPPDGGWGWVIVTSSFFCNVFVDGIVYTFGVFLEDIGNTLGESKAKVSLVGSLLSGFYLITGPIASALANRYGFRLVSIMGSIIACVAFAMCTLVSSIEALCLWYGIIGGFGFGLIYVPAVITTGFYFEKWRALATGIAVCGSGIGTFVLAPLTTYLIKEVGWRGAMLIQGGMVLNCAIFGAMFRPLKPKRVTILSEENLMECDKTSLNRAQTPDGSNGVPLLMRIKMARLAYEKAGSIGSLDHVEEPPTETSKFLGANNNAHYPTVKQIIDGSLENLNLSQSIHASHNNLKNSRLDALARNEKRLSVPIYPESITCHPQKIPCLADDEDQLNSCLPNDALLSKQNGDNIYYIQKAAKQNGKSLPPGPEPAKDGSNAGHFVGARSRTMSNSSHNSNRSRSRKGVDGAIRPMYRDDIFYTASLNKLPQYTSQISGLEYTLSVTRLPTWNDVQEEKEKRCRLCPEAVRRTLATMLDITVLSSPTFLLLGISSFITMMGFYVPFMFLTDRAKNVGGMDPDVAIWLVSTIGITNTFGRVACGLLTSLPGINALFINNAALTVGGITTILSGYSLGSTYQFSYAAIFGLAISCFASLRSILVVDLIGLEKLTNAFGLLLLFQGLAAAIGAPIAGLFMDFVGSYNASFYLSGTLILVSGIMCYPLNRVKEWERNRQNSGSPKVV